MESIWFELVIIFVLILGNGFFAGAELALVSARRGRGWYALISTVQPRKELEAQGDRHFSLLGRDLGAEKARQRQNIK
jgi:CBS domain containing-hemolysin-like protein